MNRLAQPDGSLADLTMLSSSPEPLGKEKEKEMLMVDGVAEEKKKDEESLHDDSQQDSLATDPEMPSEESSGNVAIDTLNCQKCSRHASR